MSFFPSSKSRDSSHISQPRSEASSQSATQACLNLLTSDPHKAVSVAEAAFKRILELGRFPFWVLMLTAHRAARLGENELKLLLRQFLFLALHSNMLKNCALSIWLDGRRCLSNCLRLWASQYWDPLRVVRRCNSPGSCCPGELWWGCCWGWKPRRGPPWCEGSPHSLKKTKQGRGRWSVRGYQDWTAAQFPVKSWKWALWSLPLNHETQGSWTLNSALSRSSMVRWERSNKCDSSLEAKTQS